MLGKYEFALGWAIRRRAVCVSLGSGHGGKWDEPQGREKVRRAQWVVNSASSLKAGVAAELPIRLPPCGADRVIRVVRSRGAVL